MSLPKEKVGSARKTHPLPMRLRSPYVDREHGGAKGWRGPGWGTIRKKVVARDKGRSTISGFDINQGNGLQVDHIHPFRLGGKNKLTNLRTTDYRYNAYADHMAGASEKPPKRDPRW